MHRQERQKQGTSKPWNLYLQGIAAHSSEEREREPTHNPIILGFESDGRLSIFGIIRAVFKLTELTLTRRGGKQRLVVDTRTRHDSRRRLCRRRRRRHGSSSRGMKWMLELGMGNRDPTNAACPLPVLGHTSMSSLLIWKRNFLTWTWRTSHQNEFWKFWYKVEKQDFIYLPLDLPYLILYLSEFVMQE